MNLEPIHDPQPQSRANFSQTLARPCRNEYGVAAVEVGATLGVFLLAFFAVLEFGWYFVHQTTLTSAVREGIRLGAIGNTLTDDSGNTMSREDSIKKAIHDSAATVMNIDPSSIFVFPVQANWADPSDPAVANAGGAGAFMRVRVQYNHQFFTPLIGGFFGGSTMQMTSQGTYRNEDFILAGGS